MAYTVTHQQGRAAALDVVPLGIVPGGGFTLEEALEHACRLLSAGAGNVTIKQDGSDRSISGADLIACCKREKTLTPDLQAVG